MELTAGLEDVFTDEPLSGNPHAVVEDADGLTLAQMKQIAREFNQAETTFIMQSERADRKLRSFTAAGSEVVGAGHNALGAWLWLAELGKLGPLGTPQTFHQEIGDEVLPITLTKLGGRIHGRMRQSPLKLLEPLKGVTSLAHTLGLQAEDIMKTPLPRSGDTGVAHLLVRWRFCEEQGQKDATSTPLTGNPRTKPSPASSTPPSAYGKTPQPVPPVVRLLPTLDSKAYSRTAQSQSNRAQAWPQKHAELAPDPELSGAGVIVMCGTLRL